MILENNKDGKFRDYKEYKDFNNKTVYEQALDKTNKYFIISMEGMKKLVGKTVSRANKKGTRKEMGTRTRRGRAYLEIVAKISPGQIV